MKTPPHLRSIREKFITFNWSHLFHWSICFNLFQRTISIHFLIERSSKHFTSNWTRYWNHMASLKQHSPLFLFFEEPHSGPLAQHFANIMTIVVVVSIIAFCLETENVRLVLVFLFVCFSSILVPVYSFWSNLSFNFVCSLSLLILYRPWKKTVIIYVGL